MGMILREMLFMSFDDLEWMVWYGRLDRGLVGVIGVVGFDVGVSGLLVHLLSSSFGMALMRHGRTLEQASDWTYTPRRNDGNSFS